MGRIIRFETAIEKMQDKIDEEMLEQMDKIIRAGRSSEEYDWKDWQNSFYKVEETVRRFKNVLSNEEIEEWIWKIFTQYIRTLIDYADATNKRADEMFALVDLVDKRLGN